MENPIDRQEAALAVKKGVLRQRTRRPDAYILHTTGVGVHARAARGQYTDAMAAAIGVYTRIMKACPHVVIGPDGMTVELVPENLCAWHVGSRGAQKYLRAKWPTKNTAWWRRRFAGKMSPFELAGGTLWRPYEPVAQPHIVDKIRSAIYMRGASCNANTRGIEFVPPDPKRPKGPVTDEQLESAALVLQYWAYKDGLTLSRSTIFTHSEAHPLARSRRGNPWDPADSMVAVEDVIRCIPGVPLRECAPSLAAETRRLLDKGRP